MRKIISLALAFILLIGLCACDLDTIQTTHPSTTTATKAPTEKPTETTTKAPTTAPTAKPTVAPTERTTTASTTAPTVKPTEAPTQVPTQKPTDPPHTHSWKSATCTNPKTCTECGETTGSAEGHNYSNGSCTKCGNSDPNYVSETMVWIPTKGGKKYHTRKDCSNMDDPDYVTKEEAEELGFTPCKRCH